MRKIFAVLICFSLLSLVAGCGGPSGSDGGSVPSDSDGSSDSLDSDGSEGSSDNEQADTPLESGHTLISEDQTFIVPSNAPVGEYVGRIRLFPQFEGTGAAPAFTLTQNNDGIYAIDSDGLLTIADNSSLAVGVDTVTVSITKTDHPEQSISVDIEVIDAAGVRFIDGDAAVNGLGTRASPFNAIPTVTAGNTTLLFKRGSTITSGTNYINNISAGRILKK